MTAILEINGNEVHVSEDIAHIVFMTIEAIVASGDTQPLVLDVSVNGSPGKYAVLINPATQARLWADNASIDTSRYESNVGGLAEQYLGASQGVNDA